MGFNASSKTFGADMTVYDVNDSSMLNSLHLSFGGGWNGTAQTGTGSSVFIDDNTFGAGGNVIRLSDVPDTPGYETYLASYAYQDSEGSPVLLPEQQGEFPTLYFVSSGSVQQPELPAYMGGTPFCDEACDFAEWGFFGGQERYSDPFGDTPDEEYLRESIHLATWVAGQLVYGDGEVTPYDVLTSEDNLGPVGVAHYSGHVVGTVVVYVPTGGDPIPIQYVAGGQLDLTWDLGNETGQITVSNFDGRDFGGVITPTETDYAGFSGSLSGSGLTGSTDGAFVYGGSVVDGAYVYDFDNGAGGGVIGNFDVASYDSTNNPGGSNYYATGIYVGANDTPESTESQSLEYIQGFSAGVVDAQIDGNVLPVSPIPVLGGIAINFESDGGEGPGHLSGYIDVQNGDVSLSTSFGDTYTEGPTIRSSVYVDDNTYAGWSNEEFVTRLSISTTYYYSDGPPATYVVSQNLVSSPALSPEVLALCDPCGFAELGWWGSEVTASYDGESEEPIIVHASVVSGTWVAGDVVSGPGGSSDLYDDLGTIGTAHYSGYAIGTVAYSLDDGETIQYTASGRLELTWDLGDELRADHDQQFRRPQLRRTGLSQTRGWALTARLRGRPLWRNQRRLRL